MGTFVGTRYPLFFCDLSTMNNNKPLGKRILGYEYIPLFFVVVVFFFFGKRSLISIIVVILMGMAIRYFTYLTTKK